MNNIADALADNYNISQQEGRKEISRSWKRLRPDTRAWLTSSGRYNDRGSVLDAESDAPEVEELEYNLGLINRCVAAKLPNRWDKGANIPVEARHEEVPSALAALFYQPYGQDPAFLRRALLALQRFETARLLSVMPPEKNQSSLRGASLLVFCVFCFALLLLFPLVLAHGLVSVTRGEYGDTAAALYGLGFIAWMLNIVRNFGKDAEGTIDEQTYQAWLALNGYQSGDWTAGGAGAAAYFNEMMRKGLRVPVIAFDICASLRNQALRPA
jgi:hypothetical protein